MRILVATILVGLTLSGCLDEQQRHSGTETITLAEARELARAELGGDLVITHAAMNAAFDGVLDGRSKAWILETVRGGVTQTLEVRASGEIAEADPIQQVPTAGNPPQYADCEVMGDSPPIATALARSRAWRELGLANATAHPYFDGIRVSWEAECIGGQTVWSVHSSLVQNDGGTWSSRAFWLDQQGNLAGFFGDPARGHPMSASTPTPDGINVEYTWAFAEGGLGADSASFETRNVVQLAILADLDYQGIGMPLAEGTLVATGPSGEEYTAAWAQEGSRALYIPEANPGDARGNWTVRLELDSVQVPTFLPRFEICAGIVFNPEGDACQALYEFQKAA